jgi:hypothetical protein
MSVMEGRLLAPLEFADIKSITKEMKKVIGLLDVTGNNKERFWGERMDKLYAAVVKEGKPNTITAWAALFVTVCEEWHASDLASKECSK